MNGLWISSFILTISVHFIVFITEVFLWSTPVVYERAITKIITPETVSVVDKMLTLKPLFINQGFYNLFLALGGIAGLIVYKLQNRLDLVIYICMYIVGAGIVLASTSTAYIGALVQGGPPALALVAIIMSAKRKITLQIVQTDA